MYAKFIVSLHTFVYASTNMHWSKEAKDTVWLMVLQGVNYLAPLLVWPYLMIVLGAEQFGVFSFGVALAQYLMLLVDFGFNLTATKQIALAQGDTKETNRIFSATMTAKILLLAVSAIIVAVVTLIPMYRAYRAIVWIAWLMVVGNTFSMFWLFQGLGKIRWVAIINAAMKLLILPLTFVLVTAPAHIYIAAWIQSAVFLVAGIVTVVLTRVLNLAWITRITWVEVKEQLRSSWSIFLSNAATATYTSLFVVILAYFVSADEVGRYAAAEKIMRCACYLIWIPLSQAYFPKISRLGADNREEGERLLRRITFLLALVLGVSGLALGLFAEPLALWLGKEYSGIGQIMYILAVVPMMVGIGGAQGQMGLIAMGGEKEKRAFRNVYLVAAVIALVGVCVLSYLWGAMGAAVALVITEGIVCIGMCVLNSRKR